MSKEREEMSKTFHIRSGLKPTAIKDNMKYCPDKGAYKQDKEPIKSILCEYIKDAERNAEGYSKYTQNGNENEALAEDRRHVAVTLLD